MGLSAINKIKDGNFNSVISKRAVENLKEVTMNTVMSLTETSQVRLSKELQQIIAPYKDRYKIQ